MTKKFLWVSGFIVGIIAAGGAGYWGYSRVKFGADALGTTNGSTIVCNNQKLDTSKIVIAPGGSNKTYFANKIKPLASAEVADPSGIYFRDGNKIYFSDGAKYTTQPAAKAGVEIEQIGNYWLYADSLAATDITNVAGTGNFYAYKDNLYQIDMNSYVARQGALFQDNGMTEICLANGTVYEIDVAGRAQEILGSVTVPKTFSIKATDTAGKELIKSTAGEYVVDATATVQLAVTWNGVAPTVGTAVVSYITGGTYVTQLPATKTMPYLFVVKNSGTVKIQLTFTDTATGQKYIQSVTFVQSRG